MTPSSLPPPPKPVTQSWKTTFVTVVKNISDDPGHPLQVALRTYLLCFSLVLGPALLPTIVALVVHPESFTKRARVFWRVFSRELRPIGFASAMTTAIAGGTAVQQLWNALGCRYTKHWPCIQHIKLSLFQRTFLANTLSSALAVALLRWKRYRRPGATSPTLDLTLLFFVRAFDALVQSFLLRKAREIAARRHWLSSRHDAVLQPSRVPFTPPDTRLLDRQSEHFVKEWQSRVAMHLDTLVFWASSARIMWCFFYEPQRLPPSFVKWIDSLANVDKRLLEVLRGLREGTWSYIHGSSTERDIAGSLAEELGRSPSWGDPTVLPAYGGDLGDEAWKRLGIDVRNGVGGMPCELVHGGIGATFGLQNSCIANAALRTVYAFAQALVLHLPVHFLPILLTKPSSIAFPHRAISAFLSAVRSATFLSTFASSYWFTVCFTRTLVLAWLFPKISHDVWDGPYGGTLAGSLVCGASIWIENARRRREVALYVLPKALRASISGKLLRTRHPVVHFMEYLTFTLSLASLLTFAVHQPESLRGLSRWTLAFITRGPHADLWKKRRRDTVIHPPTSTDSPIDSTAFRR